MMPQYMYASGMHALDLSTKLLQRSRLSDAQSGVWEAADRQWSWRLPRHTDGIAQRFWMDDEGPVAAILLTSSTTGPWQCDPVIVPGTLDHAEVWHATLETIGRYREFDFDVPISSQDETFGSMAMASGFIAGDQDSTGWLNPFAPPGVRTLPEGFVIVDRTERHDVIHPLHHRNGEMVEKRLHQCSFYDPALDLAVETDNGTLAGYSLYWFDPVTKVGVIEPVRVEDDFQRRGLASTMLTVGIDRLAAKGAERIKVSWESEAAGHLYLSSGFKQTSTTTWFRAPRSG